jgi:transcriptional regulator with XRE-family HTH domain
MGRADPPGERPRTRRARGRADPPVDKRGLQGTYPEIAVHKSGISASGEDARMSIRQRAADLATADARRLAQEAARDIHDARIAAGSSLAAAARRAGMSPSQLGRIERAALDRPTLDQLARAARAVGLRVSLRLYPSGAQLRDDGQLAVLGRFAALLGRGLAMAREVGLPHSGDLRAWDGRITDGNHTASVECIVRLADLQAQARAIELKRRDDPGAGSVILVIGRSAHNRAALAAHREALRVQFPLDGAAIARHLRSGHVPSEGGIIML